MIARSAEGVLDRHPAVLDRHPAVLDRRRKNDRTAAIGAFVLGWFFVVQRAAGFITDPEGTLRTRTHAINLITRCFDETFPDPFRPHVDVDPVPDIAVVSAHQPEDDPPDSGPVARSDDTGEETVITHVATERRFCTARGSGVTRRRYAATRGERIVLVAPTDETENAHTGRPTGSAHSRWIASEASGSHWPLWIALPTTSASYVRTDAISPSARSSTAPRLSSPAAMRSAISRVDLGRSRSRSGRTWRSLSAVGDGAGCSLQCEERRARHTRVFGLFLRAGRDRRLLCDRPVRACTGRVPKRQDPGNSSVPKRPCPQLGQAAR